MKRPILKSILAILAVAMLSSSDIPSNHETVPESETYVYICTGKSSKRYHKTSKCTGLDNCKGEVKKVTLKFAEDKGRTPCKICYKQR